MAAETVFASGFTPDPACALDVLAFVLCPPEVFAPTGDPEEIAAVAELIEPAAFLDVLRPAATEIDRARAPRAP